MATYSALTLESHLSNCANDSKEFEQLYSIWTLNKKNIRNAQSAINYNFPHYSLHESSHSNTIIKNIESFLGEERIYQLSATDTWLILMATFTHDLGMVVFNNVLEKQWVDEKFQEYILNLSVNSVDSDLKESAELLMNIGKKEFEYKELNLPIKVRKATTLVTAEFFRRNHHYRSKEIISGIDTEFYNYLNGFNFSGVPNRFINILAEIAYCHGVNFYEVIDKLEYKANGYGSDNMHPRFVAFLLRLGDLLDVDDKRFNIFNEKVFANNLPYASQLHKEKHASVKHLLIAPNTIEVTVDCQTDEIYRVARDWFDWLQTEVEDQGREWVNIAPKELSGIPPVISRGKIKILYKSIEPKNDLMNLRFEISNKKVFEMFEGSAIYDKVGVVFLREIIQNSLDASKLQMWKFIIDGVFDIPLRRHLKVHKNISHNDLIKLIKFPCDLPDELWDNFLIDLKVSRTGNDTIRFEIRDNGTGIAEIDLIRMTKKVGESRSLNVEYQKMKKEMPYWLKPTGAFGIGLQSLFIINKNFVIRTKANLEESKEITFYSAKNGEYSRITNSGFEMSRGTLLTIEIKEDRLSEMFENSFPSEIVNNYDFFNDKYGNIYIHKLISHVNLEFKYLSTLNVTVFDEVIKSSSISDVNDEIQESDIKLFKDNNKAIILIKSDNDKRQSHIFDVYEDDGIGGQYIIRFYTNFGEDSIGRHTHGTRYNQYLVRDIPVGDKGINYYLFEYLNIVWNFQSQETDKILNISRDKFIAATKNKITSRFLAEVYPKIISIIFNMYQEHITSTSEADAIQYFHLCLTAKMSKAKINSDFTRYCDVKLPTNFATDGSLNPITFDQFFNSKRILVVNAHNINYGKSHDDIFVSNYRDFSSNHDFKVDMIVWSYSYLYPYIKLTDYYKDEYLIYKSDEKVFIIDIYERNLDIRGITLNKESRISVLQTMVDYVERESKARAILVPIDDYWKELSVDQDFRSFFPNSEGLKHFIISPFNNSKDSVDSIVASLEVIAEQGDLEEYLMKNYIDKLVNNKMVNFIIDNNPNNSHIRSEASIKRAYAKLISELFSSADEEFLTTLKVVYSRKSNRIISDE